MVCDTCLVSHSTHTNSSASLTFHTDKFQNSGKEQMVAQLFYSHLSHTVYFAWRTWKDPGHSWRVIRIASNEVFTDSSEISPNFAIQLLTFNKLATPLCTLCDAEPINSCYLPKQSYMSKAGMILFMGNGFQWPFLLTSLISLNTCGSSMLRVEALPRTVTRCGSPIERE